MTNTKEYRLITHWLIEAPIEPIWEALTRPEEWPRWWRYVQSVTEIEKGDAAGVGAVRRYVWSSRLPYRLTFDMRTTVAVVPSLIQGEASGDLVGSGRWDLREASQHATEVQYTWTVVTDKAWMNALAPILSPVFAWNHDQVMRAGGEGLARRLGVALLEFKRGPR